MKKIILSFFVLLPFAGIAQKQLKLWYQQPAKVWTQALPLGNGRLGAMVFGNPGNELIQLNESSLWSGGPVPKSVNPGAYQYLAEVRQAVANGNYVKAAAISKKMQGFYSDSYLPLGDLHIAQNLKAAVSNYYRDLDINTAVATTRFTVNGVTYKRQVFSSAADQVIVVHLTAGKPGQLNLKIAANSQLKYINAITDDGVLLTHGKAPTRVDPNYLDLHRNPIIYNDSVSDCRGMRFALLTKAINKGGTVKRDTTGITIKNATEVTLLLSAATSFNGFNKCPVSDGRDELKISAQYLKMAAAKSFAQLLRNHIADYQHYFNRVELNLGGEKTSQALLPTDKRLIAYTNGKADNALEALYFHFGRYLLISSSRPGGIAANLQGIWNNSIRPPWSSNYTTNINVQMNYWPAEVTNLSEMHQPLMNLISQLAVNGKITAAEFYHLPGWVVHHNSDIWALSNPVGEAHGDPMWANWAMGANWLTRHQWDHYLFTNNTAFLKTQAYPIMKDAVAFTLGWLIKDKDGYWVTSPSGSPENAFKDEKGNVGTIAMASTMDMSIIRDLFSHFIKASELLNTDKALRDTVIARQAKLYPFHIGKKGNIVEWYKDWEETDPHHRHVSHLYGLYPGEQISPLGNTELAAAAKKTLELRGDEGTGWSKAWKINFWARLLDGDHAHILLHDLLHITGEDGTNYSSGGGTYANMFDAHPPFQIDGNFGATAGIAEMLLQSQTGQVFLLPALPSAWQNGDVKGLKARGNYEVSITWSNHKLSKAVVKAIDGGLCTIRSKTPVRSANINSKKDGDGYVLAIPTEKGAAYTIVTAD